MVAAHSLLVPLEVLFILESELKTKPKGGITHLALQLLKRAVCELLMGP